MNSFKDNNDLKVVSIEELKQFDGFNNLSDNEALQIINSLKELALITHNIIASNHEQPKSIPKFRKAE